MRSLVFGVVAAAGLTLVGSPAAEAQDSGWWEWALAEVVNARYGGGYERADDRYEARRRSGGLPSRAVEIILDRRGGEARDRTGRDRRRGSGPPFCRSGRGHPVHGMTWCREKGWGTSGVGRVVWQRDGGWGGIDLGRSRAPQRDGGILDRHDLMEVLGEVIFGRMVRYARPGGDDGISGRWLAPSGRSRVLQVRSRSGPVAELSDVDGDGRVDVVLVPRP